MPRMARINTNDAAGLIREFCEIRGKASHQITRFDWPNAQRGKAAIKSLWPVPRAEAQRTQRKLLVKNAQFSWIALQRGVN
jgi:hypothetical protein